MRRFAAIALPVALLGCAYRGVVPDGTYIDNLTPTQLRQAFQGTAACVVYEEDDSCESVTLVDEITDQTLRIREIGANDIANTVNEPMGQFVRELPLYREYASLFSDLEDERAQGNYRYLKSVSPSTATLDSESQRWCSRSDGTFDDTEFYFSNSLSIDLSQDQRLDPDSERQLRAFLADVINDQTFRAVIEQDAEALAGLELMRGVAQGCSQYSGVVVAGGRVQLRQISITVDGREVTYLRNAIRPYPAQAELSLRANGG